MSGGPLRPWAWGGGAFVALLMGLLPVADWIPGGHVTYAYHSTITGWWSGTLVAVGIGAILGMVWDRCRAPGPEFLARWSAWGADPRSSWIVAAVAAIAYPVTAQLVFEGRPLNIDEIVQVWQGRMYAAGSLKVPSPGPVEFFGVPNVIDAGGWRYGQFPAGGPAVLMLGALIGAEWIMVPLAGALAVFAFGRWLGHVEPSPGIRLLALLLFALCPWALLMSGTYLNHVPTLTFLVLALWGMASATSTGKALPLLGAGLALGAAATIRPVDALAFGLPAGLWLAWRVVQRSTSWSAAAGWVVAGLVPVAALAFVNASTTGAPFQFGYQVLWGNAHDLGFHPAPWGEPHTPWRGVELVALYLFRLNIHFLETPFPSLLPALIALGLAPRTSGWDRYLLVSGATLIGLYFAYWFDGYYLGPRFLYPLLPCLALWTARAGRSLVAGFGDGPLTRTLIGTGVAGAAIAALYAFPLRVIDAQHGFQAARWSPNEVSAAASAGSGLVLVRESWGAQLVARLWAVGADRSQAEAIYHTNDACILEERLGELEATGRRGPAVVRALIEASDTSGLIDSPFSPDRSESFRPGIRYSPRCIARIEEDRQGFTVYPPVLLARGGPVWVRDLHERNLPWLDEVPSGPLWLLTPPDTLTSSRPRLVPLDRDSLRRVWSAAAGR